MKVKLARTKVIASLEKKLSDLKVSYATQEEKEAKFKKVTEKWQKEVGVICIKSASKAQDVSTHKRYNDEIQVSFTLPAGIVKLPEQPQKDYDTLNEWQYKEQVGELESSIRILSMAEDEYVSASMMKEISRYL